MYTSPTLFIHFEIACPTKKTKHSQFSYYFCFLQSAFPKKREVI